MPEDYGILAHGKMLADHPRMEAYLDAIGRAVRPGAVVVDIGSGTGIFALAACRAGARRVYAIEPGAIVEVARAEASAAGCADRIEFIEALSTDVTLPEPADVVVLDVRGVLPDLQVPVALDARRRFLGPRGVIVPAIDTLWAAPVSAADLYEEHVGVWDVDTHGVDLSPLRRRAVSRWFKSRVQPVDVMADPAVLETIDYANRLTGRIHGRAGWEVARAGIAHGMIVWFDSLLHSDVAISNRPGSQELLYGQAFFPWPAPVGLAVGDAVVFELSDEADDPYHRRWRTSVTRQGGDDRNLSWVQSSSPARLALDDEVPVRLDSAGQIDLLILDLMAAGVPVGEIARRVHAADDGRFPRLIDARIHVGHLSSLYA